MMRITKPVHPGATLFKDFMEPAGLCAARLSIITGVAAITITDIIDEKCPVTADIALKFAQQFGVSAKYWLELQSQYDYAIAAEEPVS